MIASLSFLYANNVADRIAGAVFLDSVQLKLGQVQYQEIIIVQLKNESLNLLL